VHGHMLGALTAPASPEMLTATGWTDVDATSRYWRHELRYGPAVFDGFEVHAIENGRGRRHVTPCELLPAVARFFTADSSGLVCW